MEIGLAVLPLHEAEIDAAAVDAHGCTRLHASVAYAVCGDALGQTFRRRFRHSSALHFRAANVHESVEEGACGDDDALSPKFGTEHRVHTDHCAVLDHQFGGHVLPDVQVGRLIEHVAPGPDVFLTVALGAWAPHGRTFRAVEHTELEGATVGHDAHHAAERVHLAYNLTFGDTADGRIATHLRNFVHVDGHQTGAHTHACCSRCGFATCMASTDDQDVVLECHCR